MCLIALGRQVSANWPLIVAANRDEVRARPAEVMTTLQASGPAILGGRDLLAGGTWMAVNEHGLMAALTNHPAGPNPANRSRGLIPMLLAQAQTAQQALDALASDSQKPPFGPCHVLVADRSDAYYVDMSAPGQPQPPSPLQTGWTVLENRSLLKPSAKADRMRAALKALDDEQDDGNAEQWAHRLQQALSDRHSPTARPFDAILVDTALGEAVVGAAAKNGAIAYGTRSSNIALIPDGGRSELYYTDGPPDRAPLRLAVWPS